MWVSREKIKELEADNKLLRQRIKVIEDLL